MDRLEIAHISKDVAVSAFDHNDWLSATPVNIRTYWSGEPAPEDRAVEVRLLWSDAALYVRFEAEQREPLIVSEKFDTSRKTMALWNRDVCEIFIAPDALSPTRYFEFEVAPTGEWIDVGIVSTPEGRVSDWEYASGMQAAAEIRSSKVVEVIRVPFAALGRTPKAGDVWRGNLFRCVGAGETRGYLAWQPTKTPQPAFHVPDAFGEFEFRK